MDVQLADCRETRFEAYVEGLASVIGHADRAGPLRDLLPGVGDALRSQERRANSGNHGARADRRAASVAAAFRWPVLLV